MLIFIEGTPGVGKSTLASYLSSSLMVPIYTRDNVVVGKHEYYEDNKNCLLTLKEDASYIFDRFIWSDVVFSYIFERKVTLDGFFSLLGILQSFPYILIYLDRKIRRQTHSQFSDIDLAAMDGIYKFLLEFEKSTHLLYAYDKSKEEIYESLEKRGVFS